MIIFGVFFLLLFFMMALPYGQFMYEKSISYSVKVFYLFLLLGKMIIIYETNLYF